MDFAISNYRRVWVFEGTRAGHSNPFQSHIGRAVFVRAYCVATHLANKAISRLPVCLARVAALRTPLACMARINPQKRNTGHRAFVFQEGTQLRKTPTVQLCPLALTSPYPRPDSIEILYGNHSIRAFSERDYASRNFMVRVAREAGLPETTLPHQAARGFCADALQLSAKCSVAVTNLVQLCSGVFVPVRVNRYVYDAKVNTKNVNGLNLPFLWNLNGNVQKPFVMANNEVGFATGIGQQDPLFLTAYKRHLGSPIYGPYVHGGLNQVKRKYSAIVGDAAVLSELTLNIHAKLVRIGNFCVEKTYDLRRQRELFADCMVKSLVQREATKLLSLPSKFRQAVGGGICRYKRLQQSLRLILGRQQLYLCCQLQHAYCASNV